MIYIIGAGISGLIAAYQAAKEFGGENVVIIEKDIAAGGVLRGIFYPEHKTHFDNGTHIFRMTGIEKLDELLINCIGDSQIQFHEKIKIGAIYDNGLQENSHYPDIRGKKNLIELRKDILNQQREKAEIRAKIPISLIEAAYNRFGVLYADETLLPALRNLYRADPKQLSSSAINLSGLSRCIAFSETEWKYNSHLNEFRSIFGYPNQNTMPSVFANKLIQYYAKSNGTNSVIIGLVTLLKKIGVTIETGVINLQINKKYSTITYENRNSSVILDKSPTGIILANGLLGTAAALGLPIPTFNKTPKLAFYHLRLDSPPKNQLAYFSNFNKKFPFSRVTNYKILTNNCRDNRITVEMLIDDRNKIPSANRVLSDLKKIGFLDSEKIKFSEFLYLKSYYPYPDLNNAKIINILSKKLSQYKALKNFSLLHINPENLFQHNLTAFAFQETAKFVKSLK